MILKYINAISKDSMDLLDSMASRILNPALFQIPFNFIQKILTSEFEFNARGIRLAVDKTPDNELIIRNQSYGLLNICLPIPCSDKEDSGVPYNAEELASGYVKPRSGSISIDGRLSFWRGSLGSTAPSILDGTFQCSPALDLTLAKKEVIYPIMIHQSTTPRQVNDVPEIYFLIEDIRHKPEYRQFLYNPERIGR